MTMLGSLLLLAVLAAPPDVDGLRRELDEVAQRIEQLKGRALAGESVESELEPLLVRSQELAAELERVRPEPPAPPAAAVADVDRADRERADELRTEAAVVRAQAARLGDVLAGVEARIAAALRAATAERAPGPRATLTSTAPAAEVSRSRTELTALVRDRAQLERSIVALGEQATRLEALANALDAE